MALTVSRVVFGFIVKYSSSKDSLTICDSECPDLYYTYVFTVQALLLDDNIIC
jgi:hypothetical protein